MLRVERIGERCSMLKIISSKNDSEIYALARKEKDKAKVASSFLDCDIEDSLTNAENISIFGNFIFGIEKLIFGREKLIFGLDG